MWLFKKAEMKATDTESKLRLFREAIRQTQEAILITDAHEKIMFANDAFFEITGFANSDVIGQPLSVINPGLHTPEFMEALETELRKTGVWKGEFKNRRKTGEIYPTWLTISVIKDEKGEATNYVAVLTDLTSAKETEDKLYQLSHIDPVTNLPNRKVFFDQLQQTVQRAGRQNSKCAIIFLDIERFKEINDSLGHTAGDKFLMEFAQILEKNLKEGDFLARLGGDEFAIIIETLEGDMDVALRVDKIESYFSDPITISGQDIYPNAAIGIAIYPEDGSDAETLAKNADTALSAVQGQSGPKHRFFTQKLNVRMIRHFWMESNLRKALGTDQLVPFFQAQVDLATGKPDEAEVLIRWKHPQHGSISPGDFIPIAEKTGLIESISAELLANTCKHLREFRVKKLPIKLLAVNLSARLFSLPDLAHQIEKQVADFGLTPADLLLEVTESTIMTQPEMASSILSDLKEMGFAIAIDDFGTGYSSLSYLQKFSVDQVKIDQSFVEGIEDGTESYSIVKAIIAMCSSLGLETLAEGVETKAQLEILHELGCNKIQGYYISRPLPADEYERFLRSYKPVI